MRHRLVTLIVATVILTVFSLILFGQGQRGGGDEAAAAVGEIAGAGGEGVAVRGVHHRLHVGPEAGVSAGVLGRGGAHEVMGAPGGSG